MAAALEFDDQSVKQVVSNIQELKDKLPEAMQKCLAFFAGCDRSVQGYEGLIAAQQCLPNNEVRDNFAAEYSVLNKIWEALSPDTVLGPFEKDYKWLSQVYQSVQPSSGHGKLIWHSLGANPCAVTERVHGGGQQIQAYVRFRLDVSLLLRIGHRGRAHAGHVFQSLLDVLGAGRAGHALDVKGDRFNHDRALTA